MTTLSQSKIIREYPLPCTPEVVSLELTGDWQILRVDTKFAKPYLYVLEDHRGETSPVQLAVIPTNEPVDPAVVSGLSTYVGSYFVHVPTAMLHVFGPLTARAVARAAAHLPPDRLSAAAVPAGATPATAAANN